MPADPNRIGVWLKSLGMLVNARMSQEEAEAQIAIYTKMLMVEFETEAFCQRSLADVAKGCRYWPSYADLHEALSKWWQVHRPAVPRLAAPDPEVSFRDDLRKSWDNPDGIRKSRALCSGDGPNLRLLAKCVARNAPQHLHLIPRHLWPEGADRTIEHEVAA